jgi:hemerythrin
MDDQHGILMDAMNELRLAVVRGAGREQTSELLDRLIELTRMHFQSEEQLMAQTSYPDLEHHGDGVQMSTLMAYLRDWFMEHIEGLDQEYGPWLNERGIR